MQSACDLVRPACRQLAELILPAQCVFCARRTGGPLCCDACCELLPRNVSSCVRCANPLPSAAGTVSICASCQTHHLPFVAAAAPLLYEFPVNTAIKAMKYRRHLFYLPVFGKFLHETLERCFADSEILVPVPLHRLRHARRGFNQAEELCRQLASRLPLPVATDVRRIRSTQSQSGLTAADRHKNVDGAFAAGNAVRGRRALIVDDVMTTGQTCRALTTTLLRAGASEVSVLTIARARQRL